MDECKPLVPGEAGFRTLKLLSEDPANYDSAPREGIRRILEEVTAGRPPPTTALMLRRKLHLKAEVESSIPHFSFKRFVTGGFNLDLIGSTCTALPRGPAL